MTRDYFFLILGVFLISNLLTGCNKEIHPNDYLTIQSSKVKNVESFVNLEQINDYASRCFSQTRGDSEGN